MTCDVRFFADANRKRTKERRSDRNCADQWKQGVNNLIEAVTEEKMI